jgi:hypothetical protein
MTIDRYEVEPDSYDDDWGNPEVSVVHYQKPAGDWCKTDDVKHLENEYDKLQVQVDGAEVIIRRMTEDHDYRIGNSGDMVNDAYYWVQKLDNDA